MKKIYLNMKFRRGFFVLVWVVIWQIISKVVDQELFIASPIVVVKSIFNLIITTGFWKIINFTMIRIGVGFFLGMTLGVVLGIIASKSMLFREIMNIPMIIIKSVPVASFIIIALVWISSRNLSVFISFLMVIPVFYNNTLKGIESIDKKLLEMSTIYRVNGIKKIRYIYIPEVMPYFKSSANISLGFCWKAGVAAEVIGIPSGSIGESLYNAKIFLNTSDLFAWTIVIVLVSIVFEKIFLLILNELEKKIYC